jgi:anti-sigma regulatory factor (Ser/Thr protein kinase)
MSQLKLRALDSAVPCARLHARAIALEWGMPDLADDIEQIVSELASNAIHATVHTPDDGLTDPVIGLWLASDLRSVLIQVQDSSGLMPLRQDPGPDAESGRGLLIVETLSKEWGTYRKAEGKVVWAMIR